MQNIDVFQLVVGELNFLLSKRAENGGNLINFDEGKNPWKTKVAENFFFTFFSINKTLKELPIKIVSLNWLPVKL